MRKQTLKILLALTMCSILFSAPLTTNASVKNYRKDNSGVTFTLNKGMMRINVYKADIIEVKYTMLDNIPSKNSLVITNKWLNNTPFTTAETPNEITITTSRLKVIINKLTNAIRYTDLNNNIITAEDENDGKMMKAATIAGISTYNCATTFKSPLNEGLFGLGCHPEDTLSINYKGRNQDLAIRYMTGAIPVLLSTKGYGLLWDNYAASNFYGSEEGNTKFTYVSESGQMVDYYFFYGPEPDQVINEYRIATGKAPMFGKWAFGLFQSQDRYKTQAEVLSVADNYRKNHIPVDVIVQDWYYWDPLPIGSHVMYPTNYPNPKAMVDQLHNENFHAMISIWPVFGKGTKDYDALKTSGGLTGITWDNVVTHTFDSYYDAHNPKAREMYWNQARDSLIKRYGWDAWWIDQCEPDNGKLLDERKKDNFYIGKGIDYFNTYSLVHTDGIYGGWRRDIPGKRAFFLARQAFAGQQRNAATLWSSDISCTFRAYKSQVPQGINACASGIPYWTSDIGGYHLRWNAPDWSLAENRELFTRWFQFGTFCPIFRIHGKGERALFSKNWDDKTKATLMKFDNLRYRLMPYIYSLAGKVTTDNYTIMRSLVFDFRNDPKVYNIPDQYMFGPAFLVSPVTEQLYTGRNAIGKDKTRKVYLPAATKWFNFWTGEVLNGGQTLSPAVPLDMLPLYVRAGSVVPMGPLMEYSTEKPNAAIELRIYAGANGTFTMYEDEGENYNYEKGHYATFMFTWNDKQRSLTISNRKGTYAGMPAQHVLNIVLVNQQNGTGVQESRNINKSLTYSGKAMMVKF